MKATVLFLCLCALAGIVSLGAGRVHADVVTEWNVIAVNASGVSGLDPLLQARAIAIVHAAIYDAVNAIDRRRGVYAIDVNAPSGVSPEAAAGAAAQGRRGAIHDQRRAAVRNARPATARQRRICETGE